MGNFHIWQLKRISIRRCVTRRRKRREKFHLLEMPLKIFFCEKLSDFRKLNNFVEVWSKRLENYSSVVVEEKWFRKNQSDVIEHFLGDESLLRKVQFQCPISLFSETLAREAKYPGPCQFLLLFRRGSKSASSEFTKRVVHFDVQRFHSHLCD